MIILLYQNLKHVLMLRVSHAYLILQRIKKALTLQNIILENGIASTQGRGYLCRW